MGKTNLFPAVITVWARGWSRISNKPPVVPMWFSSITNTGFIAVQWRVLQFLSHQSRLPGNVSWGVAWFITQTVGFFFPRCFYLVIENPDRYLLMNTIIFRSKNFLSAHNKIFILKLQTKVRIAGRSCGHSPKFAIYF